MSDSNFSLPYYGYNFFYTGLQQNPYCYYPYGNWQYPIEYNYFQTPLIENQNLLHQTEFKNPYIPQTALIDQNSIERSSQSEPRSSTDQKRKPQNLKIIKKCQKEDRNLNAIVLRNFLNFVHGNTKILPIVQNIIKKHHLEIKTLQYFELLKESLPPKQSYVGVGRTKSFIELDKDKVGIKMITLILLKKFIHENLFVMLVHSKKVSVKSREKEMRHGKKFWEFLVKEVL